jgi:hypothetical protein
MERLEAQRVAVTRDSLLKGIPATWLKSGVNLRLECRCLSFFARGSCRGLKNPKTRRHRDQATVTSRRKYVRLQNFN